MRTLNRGDGGATMGPLMSAAPSLDALRARRADVIEIAARHGATNVRVFGSVARGSADERSDVDFLVDFDDGRSLLDLVRLERDLRALLDVDVDVVTEAELRPRNKPSILAAAQAL
jgi:predicted nucleotidyltransferase